MQVTEQINLYIAGRPEWQCKLLVRLRQLIHSTDTDITEAWRWNSPHFDHNGIMIGLVAHKNFVSVWFHKGALLKDPKGILEKVAKGDVKGMRAYKLKEGDGINEAAFVDLIAQSIRNDQDGAKPSDAKPARKKLVVPPDLENVLQNDEQALGHWNKFTYTKKKEYVEWITDAAKEETRKRRIAQAFQMIREGEGKEDKYRVS